MIKKPGTFKQVNVGQSVVLNDEYLVENHKSLQIEAIALKTMENAEKNAQEILESARNEAQEIFAAAHERAAIIIEEEGYKQRDAVIKQGYDEGFQSGLETGYQHIANEIADKIRMADCIVEKAFEAEKQLVEHYNTQIAELIQYILTLVLREELKTTPAHLLALIQQAAQRISNTGGGRIILNPETLQTLRDISPETMAALTELQCIAFQADSSCGAFEMYLESVESAFDISPENLATLYARTACKSIEVSPAFHCETTEAETQYADEAEFLDEADEIKRAMVAQRLASLNDHSESAFPVETDIPEALSEEDDAPHD